MALDIDVDDLISSLKQTIDVTTVNQASEHLAAITFRYKEREWSAYVQTFIEGVPTIAINEYLGDVPGDFVAAAARWVAFGGSSTHLGGCHLQMFDDSSDVSMFYQARVPATAASDAWLLTATTEVLIARDEVRTLFGVFI